MKTYKILLLGAACAASYAVYAASDRIDVYDKEGKFVSIMVDDIREINVGKSADGQGYSTIKITTPQGVVTQNISDVAELKYSPVILYKAHDIFISNDEHSKVRLLDWRNNTDIFGEAQIDPTKPDDWRGCWADGVPHFHVDTDKGYVSEFFVTGKYTGKVYTDNPNFVYWSTKDNNLLGVDSYAFDMPFEPVEISSKAYELDTYADAPFLGDYKGYMVATTNNRISHLPASTLSVHFDANTTYTFKSTDEHKFDVHDIYTWNEEKNTVSYIPYEGGMRNPLEIDVWYGIIGKFIDGDILLATVHNIVEDKLENNVRYFITKDDIDYTVAAADDYEQRFLVQAITADKKARYFFYDHLTVYPIEVTMEWIFGNNIGKDCTAYCLSNGERIFKYNYNGPGYTPSFTFRGLEYGTYTGDKGQLTLDGFGKCVLGESNGSYTIEDGVVSVTIGNNTFVLVIDSTARTYTQMVSDAWTGRPVYTLTTASGAYNGGPLNTNNKMSVSFDLDLRGNPLPGSASVLFEVARTDGFSASITVTQDIGTYVYDASTNTVVISNLYMGTSPYSSGNRNLTLKVSDDMLSMWVDDTDEDRLYSTSRDGSYLLTGKVNTLTAPAPKLPTLQDKYSAAPQIVAFGNKSDVQEATLTIDKASSKATLYVKAMGTAVINSTVDYVLTQKTLTLKGIPSCPDTSVFNPTTEPIDFVLNVENDGKKLTTEQTLFPVAINMAFEVDFSSTAFEPAE